MKNWFENINIKSGNIYIPFPVKRLRLGVVGVTSNNLNHLVNRIDQEFILSKFGKEENPTDCLLDIEC